MHLMKIDDMYVRGKVKRLFKGETKTWKKRGINKTQIANELKREKLSLDLILLSWRDNEYTKHLLEFLFPVNSR